MTKPTIFLWLAVILAGFVGAGNRVANLGGTTGDATTGLTYNWDFNENTGTTATDSVASLVLNDEGSGIFWGTAHAGASSADFNGATYFENTSASALDFGANAFSVGCWVYPDALPAILWFSGGINVKGVYLYLASDGKVQFITSQDGTYQETATATGVATTGSWQHYTVTRSGSTVKIYKNGSDVTSVSGTHSDPAATSLVILGSYNGGSNYLDGRLDQLRIYSRALTAADVLALYNL